MALAKTAICKVAASAIKEDRKEISTRESVTSLRRYYPDQVQRV